MHIQEIKVPAEPTTTQLIFVPNPDLDWIGDAASRYIKARI